MDTAAGCGSVTASTGRTILQNFYHQSSDSQYCGEQLAAAGAADVAAEEMADALKIGDLSASRGVRYGFAGAVLVGAVAERDGNRYDEAVGVLDLVSARFV